MQTGLTMIVSTRGPSEAACEDRFGSQTSCLDDATSREALSNAGGRGHLEADLLLEAAHLRERRELERDARRLGRRRLVAADDVRVDV